MIKAYDYFIEENPIEGTKQTANRLAKNILLEAIFNAEEGWTEVDTWNVNSMTETEKAKVNFELSKRVAKITRDFGL